MRSAAEAAPAQLHLPELARSPERFDLPDEEARYVARVVRARVGERLHASDGAGSLAELVIESLRPAPSVRVVSRAQAPPREPRVLLCGAPEGERADWMVEKLAELGVTWFAPVETRRSPWPARDRAARWHRLAVAALRQSRSAWLMSCSAPAGLEEAVAALAGLSPGERWLAEPGGRAASPGPSPRAGALAGAVGGSSGFSEDERRFLKEQGFEPVTLARDRLRTETAAIALAAHWAGLDAAPRPPA